ncbi:MAG: SufD family Fe-S cluster assembly protein [Ilumatobacteraceae bacterium]
MRSCRSPTPARVSTRTPQRQDGARQRPTRRRRSCRSRSARTAASPPTAASCGSTRVRSCKSHVECDALLLDEDSVSKTLPYMEVGERDAQIGHEATVSKIADEQIFYLTSRGLSEEQAMSMVVNGFIEPITRTLPMEYAVEWSRLIELQMEGSVG